MALTYFQLIISSFSIVLGVLMLIIWIFLLKYEKIPIVSNSRTKSFLKIFIELLSSSILVIGGLGVIFQRIWGSPLLVVGLGLSLFAMVDITNQYVEMKTWTLFGLFFIIAVTMAVLTFVLLFP
jgi:hypothetical protein